MSKTAISVLAILLAACGGDDPGAAKSGEPAVAPTRMTGDAKADAGVQPIVASVDQLDAVGMAKVELGKWLFFDPRLSSTGKMSCSTCHLPDHAWIDGKRFSPKHDGSLNTRNTPTMYNVGSLERLYWDGRALGLDKNILAAWKAQMGGNPEAVTSALLAIPQYTAQFRLAAIDGPSESGIVTALATFLRSLKSAGSPFDQWRAGKPEAVSAEAKRGYELFMGKAGCAVCHQEPLFTDRVFHNTGVGMDAAKPDPGAGGEKAQNDPRLTGYFKTPTLREVAATAPYFHDGSVDKLEDAVRFMAQGGRDNPHKSPELINRNLTDAEIAQLVEFLRTLTSPSKVTAPTLPN